MKDTTETKSPGPKKKICPTCNGAKCTIKGHCMNAAICPTCSGEGTIPTSNTHFPVSSAKKQWDY